MVKMEGTRIEVNHKHLELRIGDMSDSIGSLTYLLLLYVRFTSHASVCTRIQHMAA